MIDLRTGQLRAVLAVADERHFGRAARSLGVAQSALSQQVRRVEAVVGAPLFERTSRRVALTPAGAELVREARRVLRDLDRAVARTRAVAAGEAGTLVVGAQAAARTTLAPEAIGRLAGTAPGLRIDLRALTSADAVAGLRDGTLDAALVRDLPPQDGLRVRTLATEPVLVAAPSGHRLAGAAPVRLGDLAAESFISWRREGAPEFHDRVAAACHAAGFTPRVVYEMRGIEARLGLVAAGLGVALEPASYAVLRRAGVAFLGLVGDPVHATVQVAWPAVGEAPGLAAFLDAVAAAAASAGPS